MSIGQLQSIRYAVLNFLQDVKVLVSIFVSRGQQYPDGSFKHTPPNHFYKGKYVLQFALRLLSFYPDFILSFYKFLQSEFLIWMKFGKNSFILIFWKTHSIQILVRFNLSTKNNFHILIKRKFLCN